MNMLSVRINEQQVRLVLRNNQIARAIADIVPFKARVRRWGGTLMFDCPLPVIPQTNIGETELSPGDVAFWSDGSSIIMGFGPTPLSSGREIRLAHPSTVWADALDDLAAFADIRTGCEVEVDLETDLKHSPVKTASGQ